MLGRLRLGQVGRQHLAGVAGGAPVIGSAPLTQSLGSFWVVPGAFPVAPIVSLGWSSAARCSSIRSPYVGTGDISHRSCPLTTYVGR